MKRPVLFLLTCVVLLAAAAPASAQAAKIGVFDSLRISEETVEGQKLQAQLKQYLDRKQAEIAAKEQKLGDLQTQLNSQSLSLSTDKRSGMEREVQRKMLELNSMREAAMREWQLERSEAGSAFEKQLLGVVEEFGKREGFALLLERSQVAFAADAVDVTTALVDLFNQMAQPAPEAAGGTGGGDGN